jgi:hypothetical protein
MKRLLLLTGSCLTLLVIAPTRAADKPEADPMGLKTDAEYFPLKLGTTWTYKEKTSKKSFVVKVVKYQDLTIKKDGKEMKLRCARLDTTEQGKKEAATNELVTVMDDGIYRCKLADQLVDPPARIVPLTFDKDNKEWNVSSKVGNKSLKVHFTADAQEVTVPAGKYEAALQLKSSDYQVDKEEIQATVWYAKNVGMVKLDMKVNGVAMVLELEEFKAGE